MKDFRRGLAIALLAIAGCSSLPKPVAETPLPYHLKYFGYWGDSTDFMDELLGFANCAMINADSDTPGGLGPPLLKAKQHGMKGVMGVGNIFLDGKMRLKDGCRARWEKYAADIRPHMDNVLAFFLVDEPLTWAKGHWNIFTPDGTIVFQGSYKELGAELGRLKEKYKSPIKYEQLPWEPIRQDLDKATAIIKETFPDTPVMIDFAGDIFEHAETAKSATAGKAPKPGPPFRYSMPQNADWIGLECYDVTADFHKIIALLKSRLTDKQKIVIIPNATSFGHRSTPELLKLADHLFDVAAAEPSAVTLMPFMWQGSWDPVDSLRGARDVPEIKAKYMSIGKRFVARDRARNNQFPYWVLFLPGDGRILFQGTQEELLKERERLKEKYKSDISYSKIEPEE